MSLNVYILTYNRAVFLRDSIESVLKQSYRNFNLYILDNCSTDNTTDVVHSFADERLHYIKHELNIGGGGNIEFAINHCKADYFVIFHDDDIMLPNLLEREIKIMESNDDIAVVSSNAFRLTGNGGGGGKNQILLKKAGGMYSSGKCYLTYLATGKSLIFPSLMYKKSFLELNNVKLTPAAGPCADVVFYCDIEKKGGKIFEIPEALMYYRVHSGQDSHQNNNIYFMELQLFEYLMKDDYYKIPLQSYTQLIYDRYYIRAMYKYFRGMISEKHYIDVKNGFKECLNVKRSKWDIVEKFLKLYLFFNNHKINKSKD